MNKEQDISAEMLRALVSYETATGVFCWRSSAGGVMPGSVAGNLNSNGYMVLGLVGTKYRQHRLAWLYVHGVWPNGTIDHIDGNRKNNALSNLRDVPQQLNNQNQVRPGRANTSGYLGVYWSERLKGYVGQVRVDGKKKRRGPYKTPERAHQAYIELKRIHHEGCTL